MPTTRHPSRRSPQPEGSRNSPTQLDQPERARRGSPLVALSFLYRLVQRVLEVVRVHRWMPRPRTRRSWYSAISWPYSAARSTVLVSPGPIVHLSLIHISEP